MYRVRARFRKQRPKGNKLNTGRTEEVESDAPPRRIMGKLMLLALSKLEPSDGIQTQAPRGATSAIPAKDASASSRSNIVNCLSHSLSFFFSYNTSLFILLIIRHLSPTEASHPHIMASPRMSNPGFPPRNPASPTRRLNTSPRATPNHRHRPPQNQPPRHARRHERSRRPQTRSCSHQRRRSRRHWRRWLHARHAA